MENIDFKLNQLPTDSISAVKFHPSAAKLLVSSWDKSLRLYDTTENALLLQTAQKAAILDCAFINADGAKCVSGGLEKRVVVTDIETGHSTALGQHKGSVRCVEADPASGLIFSGGWDAAVKAWDLRSASPEVHGRSVEGKVYAMACSAPHLVVSTSRKKNYVFDVRRLSEAREVRDSTLRQQIRCVRCNPDQKSFAYSSTEGRVSIEYFDWEQKSKGYTFKCHRQTDKAINTTTVYPVNAIAFHPIYHTFATGGCDGYVTMWDGYNKKKVAQIRKYSVGVSSLDISPDGAKMAIACSYTWEKGEKPKEDEWVQIIALRENQVNKKMT